MRGGVSNGVLRPLRSLLPRALDSDGHWLSTSASGGGDAAREARGETIFLSTLQGSVDTAGLLA
jgi:hypothetical protein